MKKVSKLVVMVWLWKDKQPQLSFLGRWSSELRLWPFRVQTHLWRSTTCGKDYVWKFYHFGDQPRWTNCQWFAQMCWMTVVLREFSTSCHSITLVLIALPVMQTWLAYVIARLWFQVPVNLTCTTRNEMGCLHGYYLINSQTNTILSCNNIIDFGKCTKCEDGYELNENGKCSLIV